MLYYTFKHGFRDCPEQEAMTIDEVITFVSSIRLTPEDESLRSFRPDIFDPANVRHIVSALGENSSLGLWGEDEWSVARDFYSEGDSQ